MSIRFSGGYYETEDKQEIALLTKQDAVTVAETKADLYERAQDLEIEGRSQMDRDELEGEVVSEIVEP